MSLVIKTKSFQLLKQYGCDSNGIATLISLGITLQKGEDFVTFWHGVKGYKLKVAWMTPFPELSADLNSFMLFVLNEIEEEKKVKHWIPDAPSGTMVTVSKASVVPLPTNSVIPLRDAQAMYQRVIGTSSGSVYVVVALSDVLRVAAKIEGNDNNLSVRVEGPGLDDPLLRLKLEKQLLSLKVNTSGNFKYMSGHYDCNVDAPPAKVLGAILVGSGIEFNTPLPKVAKVKEGSE